jgi:hypothetical protein
MERYGKVHCRWWEVGGGWWERWSFLHERSQSGSGGWGFEGEEAVEGLGESVFGGGAVAGQGVEAGDVGCDRAGGKGRGVEAIDLAGFPDCQGHRADTGFFGGGCGVVLGAEGLEDCVEFKGRWGEAGTETVFAGVAAGRSFAAGGSRAGAAAGVGAVGGDPGGGGHGRHAAFGTGCDAVCLRAA